VKQFRKILNFRVLYLLTSGCLISVYLAGFVIPKVDLTADPIGDKLRVLNSARTVWASQNITHYRMVVEYEEQFTNWGCHEIVEVLNEQIIHVDENPCHFPLFTVSTLFTQIEQDTTEIDWVNGYCDYMAVYPSFNTTKGYPEKIEYRQEPASSSNVGGITYLKTHPLGDQQACTLLLMFRETIRVRSLTPVIQMTF
jgi:hypothetical protein